MTIQIKDVEQLDELISIIKSNSYPDEVSKETMLEYLESLLKLLEKHKGYEHFGLPPRLVDEFGAKAIGYIRRYCDSNGAELTDAGVDICVGGYEKWLKTNDFKIIDLK